MKLVLGIIIWIISILFIGIPVSILKIYKLLLEAITTRQEIKDEKWFPLSTLDTVCAPDSSWVKSHINVGFVLKLRRNVDGKYFSVQELRDRFVKVFLDKNIKGGKYGKFTSYIESKGGYVFRVEKQSVDLEKHILQLKWRNDGRYHCLEDMLAKWWAKKWEEKEPCWEMILIENPRGEGQGQLVLGFKIHHGFADGYSLLHILDVLTGCRSPYLVRDFEETTFTKIKTLFECAPHLLRLKGFSSEDNLLRVQLTKSNIYDFILSFTSFPLEAIKAIKRKHHVHVASVIFAIVIGALKRFAETDSKQTQIPTQFGFFTVQPWPRHPSRDSNTPNVDKICNHWSMGNGKIALDEEDPIKRMKKIELELENFKDLGLSKFANRVAMPFRSTLPGFLNHFQVANGYGALLRSLVGADKYSLMECEVENIYPIASPQDTIPYIPVLCLTFSHSGVMDMSVKFHTSVVKDQETANMISQELFRQEFDALLKA